MTHSNKVALITGAARRIGAHMAKYLHDRGFDIAIHYHHHHQEAQNLLAELNHKRADSAMSVAADFDDPSSYQQLITQVNNHFGRLDVLVNNASSYFPTEFGHITEENWHSLINPNAKAPLFLSQAARGLLKESKGCIVNIVDINANHPKKGYLVYCMAKASLCTLTKGLAKELGPEIRVNGVSPGAILWPEGANEMSDADKQNRIESSALKKKGEAEDIAQAVYYFMSAPFVTGQVLAVDGGRN